MADSEKDKAEKLAAAKKRFEQLKKEKATGSKSKSKKKTSEKLGDKNEPALKEEKEEKRDEELQAESDNKDGEVKDASEPTAPSAMGDEALEPTEEAQDAQDDEEADESKDEVPEPETPSRTGHGRQPSLSLQSRMRSTSFRKGSVSGAPTSPSQETLSALSPDVGAGSAHEIFSKQAARLDELEKENKRLKKELETATTRQRKTEEELEELREDSSQLAELKSRSEKVTAKDEEINNLKTEITSLQRQNAHLQSSHKSNKHASPQPSSDSSSLAEQLASKSSTLESMELEISNLQAQLASSTNASSSTTAQVTALEEKLARAESAAGAAQRELTDVRSRLDKASEKAVKEGTTRTSAETKMRNLEQENEERGKLADDALKKVDNLEKKLSALTQLHKDAETRRQTSEQERVGGDKESTELRKRVGGLEAENSRLRIEREKWKRIQAGETDNEGLDELEDEERKKLETKVRELEGELYEARSGAWRERRREMQPGVNDGTVTSSGFDDIDLSGPVGGSGRRPSVRHQKGGSFANVLTSGFGALTGTSQDEGLLEDDDLGFDEEAFRAAQQEDAMKRLERVKDIKRGLKDWEGWRLDLVELRTTAGGGLGEIFEI